MTGRASVWLRPPETDHGLPGAGPIRRGEWFDELWESRRTLFSSREAEDHGAVVFFGDSITQDWGEGLPKSFPDWKTANRGISGDTTRGMLIRLQEDVVALRPEAVVFLGGTNDLEEQATPETIAGNVGLILAGLRAARPDMPVVLCEVFPSSASLQRPRGRITRLNALYGALAASDPHVTLLSTWAVFANEHGDAKPSEFPDLLHPNDAGYTKWAATLLPVLSRVLSKGPRIR
ncbi:MAG TPA: GDSL-type esterase/lipase family protein [Polyangiaceae bacterium]